MLPVPFFKQQTQYTCGPAALRMLLAFYGINKAEEELMQQVQASTITGTANVHMIEAAQQSGLMPQVVTPASLETISKILAEGRPIIVDYTEPSEDIGHYAVVIGETDAELILNDPWNGEGFKILKTDFLKRWHDPITGSTRWLLYSTLAA